MYGSSAAGIAINLGISKAEAERLINMYFDAYPLIRKYVEDSHKMAIDNHFVITPWAQSKRQYGTLDCFKKTAVYNAALRNSQNSRIQSTTSTFGLYCFAELNERLKPLGGLAVCTVFDSCEFYLPIDRAAECIEIAFETLDDWPKTVLPWLGLTVGSDAEVSSISWGQAKHINRGVTQEALVKIFTDEGRFRFDAQGKYVGLNPNVNYF